MKIARINPLQGNSNSKTAAFFDFQTDDGILIKGFRIVSGTNGLFIASPSEKGKDGKYYDSVVLPQVMKDELQKMAISEFSKEN